MIIPMELGSISLEDYLEYLQEKKISLNDEEIILIIESLIIGVVSCHKK